MVVPMCVHKVRITTSHNCNVLVTKDYIITSIVGGEKNSYATGVMGL